MKTLRIFMCTLTVSERHNLNLVFFLEVLAGGEFLWRSLLRPIAYVSLKTALPRNIFVHVLSIGRSR